MRRMTNEEMAYYAAKQRAADRKAKTRYNLTVTLVGIFLLAAITIIAALGTATENNAICVYLMIALIPVTFYLIRKVDKI